MAAPRDGTSNASTSRIDARRRCPTRHQATMTKTISLTYRSSRDRDRNTPTGESTRGSRRKRLASSKSDTAATQRSNPWSHGTLQGGERTRALRRGSSCAATLTKLRRTQSAPKRKRGALELSRSPRNTPDRPSPMSLMRRTPSTPPSRPSVNFSFLNQRPGGFCALPGLSPARLQRRFIV